MSIFNEEGSVIDICGWAYEYLLSFMYRTIEDETGCDLLNTLENPITVYANYLATSYQDTERTAKFLKRVIKKGGHNGNEDIVKFYEFIKE